MVRIPPKGKVSGSNPEGRAILSIPMIFQAFLRYALSISIVAGTLK